MAFLLCLQLLLFFVYETFPYNLENNSNNTRITLDVERSTKDDRSSIGPKPSIFLLGVQKGGSDSLYEFLTLHPDICSPYLRSHKKKEPQFFGGKFNLTETDAYLSLMNDPKCKKNKKAMYIDASTVFQVFVASNIGLHMSQFYNSHEAKKLKFIVMLREPVARDISWFNHMTRNNLAWGMKFNDTRLFQDIDITKNGKEHVLKWVCKATKESTCVPVGKEAGRRGRYLEDIQSFVSYFDRSQLLVFSSNWVYGNSVEAMEIVSNFLGIEMIADWKVKPFPRDDHLQSGRLSDAAECATTHVPPLDCDYKEELGEYYKPYNEALYKFLAKTRTKFEPPFLEFGEDYRTVPCVPQAKEWYHTNVVEKKTMKSCRDGQIGYEGFFEPYALSIHNLTRNVE